MIGRTGELLLVGGPLVTGAVSAGLAHATFAPGSSAWGPVVRRGARDGPPRVALTFDDGPCPGATDRILDVLAELEVKAAFFAIGRFARQHPRLLARVFEAGHLVGNHTYDHRGLGFLRGREFWGGQLAEAEEAIHDAIGRRPRLFRPPLGMKTWWSARAAAARGLVVITWSRRAMDGITTSSRRIVERLVPRARAGDILALHDGVSPQSGRDPTATVRAIRPLIMGLRARGLEPARLDELIGLDAYAPALPAPDAPRSLK